MAVVARIRWQSPEPSSVDEELVVYDDASALLVVRSSRDGSPAIGSWRADVAPADLEALTGQDRTVDVRRPVDDPAVTVAERVAAAARANPLATATFYASVTPQAGLALLAVGGGTGPAAFDLAVDELTAHFEDADGTEIGWRPVPRLGTGFVSPEPEGLGGVGRPAEIPPGGYGAIALDVPVPDGTAGVAVSLAGRLRDELPDELSYERFRVRTAAFAIPR